MFATYGASLNMFLAILDNKIYNKNKKKCFHLFDEDKQVVYHNIFLLLLSF